MAKWFEITNEAAAPAAKILIYDRIGKSYFDGDKAVDSKDFANSLAAIPPEREIHCHINSPGGDVYQGLAVYHQLQARSDKVTMHVDGIAASIASIILMAGKERRVPKNALVMIHDPKTMAWGSAASMRKTADTLDTHKKVLVGIYHSATGKPTKDIEDKMSAETWYTGDEAKAFGLCDTVTEEVKVKAEFDLSEFKNLPPDLKSQTSNLTAPVDSLETPVMNEKEKPAAEPSLIDKIKALLGGTPPAPEVANLSTVTAERDTALAEITNLKSEISNLKSQIDNQKSEHSSALAAKETEVENRAKTKSQEILSKAGHKAVKDEDPAKTGEAAKTKNELWAEYRTINADKGPLPAREFYVANKARM